MKKMIKVADVGQKIIDLNGYVYTVQEVFPYYVSIGNGEKIVHWEYEVISVELANEIEKISEVLMAAHSTLNAEVINSVLLKMINRFDYFEEGVHHPRHVWTFEEYTKNEGDDLYEFEYPNEWNRSN